MHQFRRFICLFCLLMNGAVTTYSKDKIQDIHERLETIIFPTIEFEDTPASDVFRYLSKESKKHDPSGKGVNIGMIRLAGDKKKQYPVTMCFDNLPLADAIRYICEQVQLRYKIKEHIVLITGPDIELAKYEWRVYRLPEELVKELSAVELEDYFSSRGVSFGRSIDGKKARVILIKKSDMLLAFNNPDNLRLIDRMTRYICGGSPPIIAVSASLRELRIPYKGGSIPRLNHKQLIKLKDRTHVLTRGMSCQVKSGSQGSGAAVEVADGRVFSQEMIVQPKCQYDGITVDLGLDWKMTMRNRSAEPKGLPLLKFSTKTTLQIWDGEAQTILLSSVFEKGHLTQQYLIVDVQMLDASSELRRDGEEVQEVLRELGIEEKREDGE